MLKNIIKIILFSLILGIGIFSYTTYNNIRNIKEATYRVYNRTGDLSGTGVVIKHKKNYYILTCNHVVVSSNKGIQVFKRDGSFIYYPSRVYLDAEKDLALLKINFIGSQATLKIHNKEIADGSKVILVSNFLGLDVVYSEGYLMRKVEDKYLFQLPIFYGSSGGAVIHENKIVTVVQSIITVTEDSHIIQFCVASSNKNLNTFLKEALKDE